MNIYAQTRPNINKSSDCGNIDCFKNYQNDNVYSYIGQVLYGHPGKIERDQTSMDSKKFGYVGFKTTNTLSNNSEYIYKKNNKTLSRTRYEAIAKKYFRVVGVVEPKEKVTRKGHTYFLKMVEEKSRDTVYYEYTYYDYEKYVEFPFIIVSHFKTLVNKYLNKTVYVVSNNINIKDINRNDVDYGTFEPLTCVDIHADTLFKNIIFIFKNLNNDTLLIYYDNNEYLKVPQEDIMVYVDTEAEYNGGYNKMMLFIEKIKNKQFNEEGYVTIKATVFKNGNICVEEIVTGMNEEYNKEAIRIIESMPKWIPGTLDGYAVDSYIYMNINF